MIPTSPSTIDVTGPLAIQQVISMSKIKVSLSQEASELLLKLMDMYGHESPTHTANVALFHLMQLIKQQSPSEDEHDHQKKQNVLKLQ